MRWLLLCITHSVILILVCGVYGRRPRAWYRTREISAARSLTTRGKANVWSQEMNVRPAVKLMRLLLHRLATSATFRRLVKVSLVHFHFVDTNAHKVFNSTAAITTGPHAGTNGIFPVRSNLIYSSLFTENGRNLRIIQLYQNKQHA